MLLNSSFKGHFLAIFTIGVWGITFSSTKILLADFAPSEILFIRFLIAFVFLSALCRHSIGFCGLKYEVIFIFAGLFGGCLYFLAENIALQYTSVSNASLLVAINPFFTGLLFAIFYHKKMSRFFIFGFIFACVGIILVIFQGNFHIEIYPVGDFCVFWLGLHGRFIHCF